MSGLQEQLLFSSTEVLRDCALPNGAIVAANSTSKNYPATAENYLYNWGRDAAFQIYAADKLRDMGLMPDAPDIKARYLGWLVNNCEGFSTTGVLVKRYYPNGPGDWRYGTEYQPDQAGALLWSLHETTQDEDKTTNHVMKLLANGLVTNWSKSHFTRPIQDLWENQLIVPEDSQVFTYSLAACIKGLGSAIERLHGSGLDNARDKWIATKDEMISILDANHLEAYSKRTPELGEQELDGSLSALVYPFDIDQMQNNEVISQKARATALAISHKLLDSRNGIIRYKGDTYDGIARSMGKEASAGSWPLLTFWNVAALSQSGEKSKAKDMYDQTLSGLSEHYKGGRLVYGHIPEQIFEDDARQGKGVSPLAWSHAKFVLATLELEK